MVLSLIRNAQPDDAIRLEQIARAVQRNLWANGIQQWSETYPGIADFQKDIAKSAYFVYEQDQLILGGLAILPENDPPYLVLPFSKGKSLVIHRVMVDPIAMRKGIGDALMAFLKTYAKHHAIEYIKVDTHPDNFRMKNYLIKHGFREVGYMVSIHRVGFEYQVI